MGFRVFIIQLWFTYICLYVTIAEDHNVQNQDAEDSSSKLGMAGYGIWYSQEELLKTFNTTEYMQLAGVRALVSTYQDVLSNPSYDPHNDPAIKDRYPFIAIEGTHRDSRIIIGKEVASFLHSTYLGNPPRTMVPLRKLFDKEKGMMRKAYFSLCMYVGAHHVRETWVREPVVTTGYWLDQAAFSIAQRFTMETLPPPGSPIYQWPEDLVRPDIAFFLNIPQLKWANKPPNQFKPRLAEVYRRIQGVKIIEINSTGTYRKIFAIIRSKLNSMFTTKLTNHDVMQEHDDRQTGGYGREHDYEGDYDKR